MSLPKIRTAWVELYVLVMLTIFPLYMHNKYYDMQIAKFTFFYVASLIMICGFVVIYIIQSIKGKLTITVCKFPYNVVLIFALCAVVSTLQSEWLYEAFWGNEGRNSGLFTLLLYSTVFLIIALNLNLKEYQITIALIAAVLVAGLGIADYFGIDLFNFKDGITGSKIAIFTSTIGNINYYTAYIAMFTVLSGVMFAVAEKPIRVCFYYIVYIILLSALILGVSDNAYISLAIFFGLSPLYLFKTRRGIQRYIVLFATFLTIIKLTVLLERIYTNPQLRLEGIYNFFAAPMAFTMLAVILWILSIVLWRTWKTDASVWFVRIWAILIFIAAAVILYVLIDVNINGNLTRYGYISKYLLFDDSWGTNRGFIWLRSIKMYSGFSLGHKIFGYGPDTFAILSHFSEYKDESIHRYREFYDSVHNEYLQYLLTIGILGLAAYIGVIVSALSGVFKKTVKNPVSKAAAFAAMAYLGQAVVSISTPVTTPYMFILLAMALSAGREVNNG